MGRYGAKTVSVPADVMIRGLGNGQKVKINWVTYHCLLVDLAAYDRLVNGEGRES